MRSMWLIVDDPDGFDTVPYGWDVVEPEPYEPINVDDELYVGRHRGVIED